MENITEVEYRVLDIPHLGFTLRSILGAATRLRMAELANPEYVDEVGRSPAHRPKYRLQHQGTIIGEIRLKSTNSNWKEVS